MFREVLVTVIVRKRVLKGYLDGLIYWPSRSPDLTPLDLCFLGWMKCEVYKIMVDTPDELLAPVLDSAARKNKRENQLRRTTRDLQTRVAKCTEVEGGIFESLL